MDFTSCKGFIERVEARGITGPKVIEGYWQDGRAKHRLLKYRGRKKAVDPAVIVRLGH